MDLLELTPRGLYCPQADSYIDPWSPVDKAIITHAHSDHCKWGMKHYLAHDSSREVIKLRLGSDVSLETVPYARVISINGVKISLHPAGHIPGSAQVRLEWKGKVEVVSGDYKIEDDGLSTPFEPVVCHRFVSECTFGLPVYQWEKQDKVMASINRWWEENAAVGHCSVLFAYALGKAQRILRHLDQRIGPIRVHGAVWNTNQALLANDIALPGAGRIAESMAKTEFRKALIIAPPSAQGTPWMKKFLPFRTAACSGWMNIRGTRRRRAVDTGFALSDHADWNGLKQAITATRAEEVLLTHGYTDVFAKYLEEIGVNASVLDTLFVGDARDGEE